MRAEIFDGVKVASHVVESQFRSVQQLDGRAAPDRHVFDPPDRDELSFAAGPFEITEPSSR
jgi:hypothetical protein